MGAVLPSASSALDDHVDNAAVFGVHADECAVFRGLAHGFEDGRVVDHEDAGIGHEEFEAGYAFVHHVVHVFESAFAEIGDDHVEAVIDAGFVFGFFPPGVEGVAHFGAFGLDGEIDDGGGASEGGGAGAGFEIVGGGGAAEGHVQVGVDVDTAGHDIAAFGVDDAIGDVDGDGFGDFGDASRLR